MTWPQCGHPDCDCPIEPGRCENCGKTVAEHVRPDGLLSCHPRAAVGPPADHIALFDGPPIRAAVDDPAARRKLDADIALGVWQNRSRSVYRCDVDGTDGNPRPCSHRDCWSLDDEDASSGAGSTQDGDDDAR